LGHWLWPNVLSTCHDGPGLQSPHSQTAVAWSPSLIRCWSSVVSFKPSDGTFRMPWWWLQVAYGKTATISTLLDIFISNKSIQEQNKNCSIMQNAYS
jgi:hypothetical protein